MTITKAAHSTSDENFEQAELDKFSALASQWWDLNGKFKPLHDINPLRLALIDSASSGIKGKRVLDIGCGGGLVSEGLAQMGGKVLGIDLAVKSLTVAKLHALESGVAVEYREISAEDLAHEMPQQFDTVTCLEMLEHVPNPAAIIEAAALLTKPGGTLIFSTISRTAKAYAMTVLGAEYILGLLPKGTHDYAKFLKPSELAAQLRKVGLDIVESKGLDYNPFTRKAKWTNDTTVNYIFVCKKPL